ncbi:glycosyltransferase family 4 protein [Gordonia sp. WA4-43]|uniref:glycosyltransferase family 4 protein n=1 Tax=Gordonia sp. WA4-43 TaxID=2878678 RepID=UPI001CFAAA8D|nr:glycosyltransferase family 4 protein [Gordonia sp. WA4-43]UCZ91853.1 glycosyltransferase family 4 protein [Gordonia sp. WA4-43]
MKREARQVTLSENEIAQSPAYLAEQHNSVGTSSLAEADAPGRHRVDFVSINYAPEVTGIGPYVTDVARRLAERGWSVRVITGYPHYPQWRLRGEMTDYQEISEIDGVTVVRVRHSIPSNAALIPRSRMELEFGLRALISRRIRPDALVVITSPPLIASAAILLLRKLGHRRAVPMGVWVHDLYSQAVSEATSGHWLTRTVVRVLERATLRGADQLAVAHSRFGDTIVDRLGGRSDSVTQLRNWNQARPKARLPRDEARAKLGISEDDIVAVHAGNMGLKQGLENVVSAARLVQQSSASSQRIHFYLVGNGNQYQKLQDQARGIDSITFIDSLPDVEFHQMLSAADVLLVNEKPGVSEMSIPSKLTTYFSFGLPVVAAVAEDGITASEIRRSGAGIVVPAGEPTALVEAVRRVGTDQALASTLGSAGMEYSSQHLSVDAAIDRFENWLHKLASKTGARR